MAASPYAFPYPSAATHPPPLRPGAYPSPFPYTLSTRNCDQIHHHQFPPAPDLPPVQAVVQSHTDLAQARVGSVDFPAPAHGAPCAFPYAATYSYPPAAFAPAPEFPPSHFGASTTSPVGAPVLVSSAAPEYGPFGFPPAVASPSTTIPPAPIREHPQPKPTFHNPASRMQPYRAYQIEKSDSFVHPAMPNFSCHDSVLTTGSNTSGASMYGEQIIHKHTGPGILSMANNDSNHGFTTHQAQNQSSFDLLHGELSKLSTLVSQFAVALGKQTTGAPLVTVSSPTATSTQFRSPTTTGSGAAASSVLHSRTSPFGASTTAYVAPQVFDEMPQQYDLHNLSCKTVFLADGSEHSYYALPEDYPLERVVHEPVFDVYDDKTEDCSNVFLDVSASTLEQQTCEEEQYESRQARKCFTKPIFSPEGPTVGVFSLTNEQSISDLEKLNGSDNLFLEKQGIEQLFKYSSKALETGQTSACLNYKSDIFDYTLEQHQQDNEEAVENVQQLRDLHWNVLVNYETRKEWDPGGSTILSSTRNKDIVGAIQTSILTQDVADYLTECNSMKHLLQSLSHLPLLSYFNILRYYNMICNWWLNIVLQSMGDQVEGLNPLYLNTPWDPGVQVMHSGIIHNSTRTMRASQWLKFSSPTACELPLSPSVQWSTLQVTSNYLNAMSSVPMMQIAIQCQVQLVQQTSELSFLSLTACIQYVGPKCINFVLHATCFILRRAAHVTQDNYLCSLYCNNVMNTSYVWDPGVKISSYDWLDILTLWSETDKPLSCTHFLYLAAW